MSITVDGWNPENSPVEVKVVYPHYLQGFSTIKGGCLGFLPSTVAWITFNLHMILATQFPNLNWPEINQILQKKIHQPEFAWTKDPPFGGKIPHATVLSDSHV